MGLIWNGTHQPNKNIVDLQPNNDWEFVNPAKNTDVDIKPLGENHQNYRIYMRSLHQPMAPDPSLGVYIPDSIRSQNIWLDMNEYGYAIDYLQDNPTSVRARATILFFEA